MRDPHSVKFNKIQSLMKTGQMVGLDRPVGRVTWSKGRLLGTKSTKQGVGTVRYLDKSLPEHELFTVKSIDISRSIGQDAATCTITLLNARGNSTQPEGLDSAGTAGYLTPGRGLTSKNAHSSVYTRLNAMDDVFGRLDIDYPTAWGYASNPYRDVFIPNTVLRTYQGYGSDSIDPSGNFYDATDDGYVAPQYDTQLYDTGVWLIDKVTFSTDGTITIECRDLAKLLIEQYIFPPLIPVDRFPLIYAPAHKATGRKEKKGRNVAKFHSSSVDRKHGHNAKIYGHRGTDAFDGQKGTYWLSESNAAHDNISWLQAKTHGEINEVVLHCWDGDYMVFVSVHENGQWQNAPHVVSGRTGTSGNNENLSAGDGNGSGGYFYVITKGDTLWDLAGTYYGDNTLWPIIARVNNNIKDPHWIFPGQRIKIPYVAGTKSPPPGNSGGHTAGSNVEIPFVIMATVPKSGKVTIALPKTYKADYVRVVFTNLTQADGGYRAGVREMKVRNHVQDTFHPSTIGKAGFIQDWSEPVKELCAWAGLTWVNVPNANAVDPLFHKTKVTDKSAPHMAIHQLGIPAPSPGDQVKIRAWGDFEFLGAGPIVATPGDYFMQKSFMDGIRQIADFMGCIFYIDESGGAQFRLPNIWNGGNFLDDTAAGSALGARFTSHPIEFHEDANLVQYEVVISDDALRSEILVIGGYLNVHKAQPVAGGYVLGYDKSTGTTSAIDFSNVLAGQYRLMILPGDTTKFIYTEKECQRMAELTALFILFSYRQGSISSPCHPALQLDDQVRIFERITNESYIHYVSSIDTHMDLESGEYSMKVSTHWLGTDPDKDWFVDKQRLTPQVMRLPAIIKRVGKQAGGGIFEQPPYGVTP